MTPTLIQHARSLVMHCQMIVRQSNVRNMEAGHAEKSAKLSDEEHIFWNRRSNLHWYCEESAVRAVQTDTLIEESCQEIYLNMMKD